MNRPKIASIAGLASALAPAGATAQSDADFPIVGVIERMRTMFRKFRINSIFIALLTVFAVATGVLAADRPTNPADWPAVKDVYKDYFLIGNTNLSASNFGANVVPGENSTAAMTVKHFNVVTPDNAMKPDSLWSAGIANTTPTFLTNFTSGINKRRSDHGQNEDRVGRLDSGADGHIGCNRCFGS